jgi:beta-phosphoglucomutase-like phosphatase (HAD superfamily)
VIIFDCNGVLVDSERIAAAVAAEEFTRIGIALLLRAAAGRHDCDGRDRWQVQAAGKLPLAACGRNA